MKKFLVIMACLFMLAGCKKEEEVVITYDYDFYDYIDVDFIGPDGYASLDLNLKDFSASDFKSEADFIKMKKIMNSLFDDIAASKYEDISNNDVIQIGVLNTFDQTELGDMSVNLNVHEITVSGLKVPKTLDLFAPENVVFYGLEGTKRVYYYFPSSSAFTKEMKDNLKYTISIDDETVERNKTILTLNADMDSNLLSSERRYGTITRYFGTNGYVIETDGERTLKATINPSALEGLSKTVLRAAVEAPVKELGVEDYDFKQIMCIQKADVPYEYYVVALFSKPNEDRNVYVKYDVDMAYVNNEVKIYSFDRESTTDEKYATEPYGNAEMLYKFELFEVADEPTEEITETAENATEQIEETAKTGE